MDRRFAHIVSHQNKYFNNRPWSAIPEAIFGFDIENEGQGHVANNAIPNPNWICNRATALKPHLTLGNGILIITGGGADVWDSVLPQHFSCASIDVIAIHSYNPNWASDLPQYVQQARTANKRIFVEEFGATGDGRSSNIQWQINAIQGTGVPWSLWEVTNPNDQSQYEVWTSDSATWQVLTSGAQAARATRSGAFSWPELK